MGLWIKILHLWAPNAKIETDPKPVQTTFPEIDQFLSILVLSWFVILTIDLVGSVSS